MPAMTNETLHFPPQDYHRRIALTHDGGLELFETILTTNTGVACLRRTPRKLIIKK